MAVAPNKLPETYLGKNKVPKVTECLNWNPVPFQNLVLERSYFLHSIIVSFMFPALRLNFSNNKGYRFF